MKKLNVRSKQVVAMVLFFIMTMTAIQLPSFAAIDSLGGNIIPTPQANVAAGEVETLVITFNRSDQGSILQTYITW